MKQVIQNLADGQLSVWDVPAPVLRPGGILVRNAASLISAGTERAATEFAEKSLLRKAQERPDLVRQVLDKVRREGVVSTFEAVQNRLQQPLALGYSCAGTVLEVATGVTGFQTGDRVACAGGGFASHAEVVFIPRNLAVPIPEGVSFEAGAFATMGAIALQGIRQAEVQLGHRIAVIGLGVLGQLTAQMLKAAGCSVFGIDLDPARVSLALSFGCDAATLPDAAATAAQSFTASRGFDAVIITAHADTNAPLELAGEIARDKGIVVAVGAVKLEIPRKPFYMKELDLRLSRSYGPGRYDPEYEERGHDYPFGYVRWTEQRNMEAFLRLVADGRVDIAPLISHRFDIADAKKGYELIQGRSGEPFTGVILTYPQDVTPAARVELSPVRPASAAVATVRLGVLGAGNFAQATMLPAIKRVPGIECVGIASGSGVTARSLAGRFGFRFCASREVDILQSPDVNTVAILTRHDLHARQVLEALRAGKNVFVEKPLVLHESELDEVMAAAEAPGAPALMVGFNRRFAPFLVDLKSRLDAVAEPLMMHYRVNAGFIPRDSWAHDPEQGGGRLLGEACHFLDLLIHLSGSVPVEVHAVALPDGGRYSGDNFHLVLTFAGGSVGSLTYVANGDKSFSKESLEVFGGGLAARLEDFRSLVIHQEGRRIERVARLRADKGHQREWEAFARHLTGAAPLPIPLPQIGYSMRATFAALRSLREGRPVRL